MRLFILAVNSILTGLSFGAIYSLARSNPAAAPLVACLTAFQLILLWIAGDKVK